ncbi:hypothetical protein SAMN05216282_10734 [Cryobacterium psychrotolerans]|uniref:Uncharacterized protein n=1 Tax=Cryobacterium psychrotolerans TaxID=386301 RepID=A0A1G9CFI3_9MICO|nr:hypothetical protein [Cryobacterium psychrotolerans]TFD84303.1 hypothetical protein E3T56_11480 [Cryobacterium psychrotolerans]SDK50195.1 hypothetical protein SAMN05216282_10734 [Cryobacterium psychrotolerans]
MRWDNLFDDLEGQLEHELQAEEIDLRAEEERLRLGRLSLRSRLVSLTRAPAPVGAGILRVALVTGETITIRPTTFGRDWLAADLLSADHLSADRSAADHRNGGRFGAQCVLPLAAIAGVILHHDQVAVSLAAESESAARVVDRIGLPFVLRDLCRRRKSLLLHTPAGLITGTIDRVGRDHIDVAVHEAGTLRRANEVQHYRIVPLAQIQLVQLD